MINVTVLPPVIGTEPFCNIGRIAVNGEVVLTTKQTAEFYGANVINIKQNFNNNKTRFIEGKHYFKLEGADLKKFKTILQNENLLDNWVESFYPVEKSSDNCLENFEAVEDNCIRNSNVVGLRTRTLYLWTKLGVLRHCKMLNTDKAWEVFEMMENTFFKVLENVHESSYKNNYFPPELSERWADVKERENEVKAAEVLTKAAKLTDSYKFREHLLKQAHSMITNKDFIEDTSKIIYE